MEINIFIIYFYQRYEYINRQNNFNILVYVYCAYSGIYNYQFKFSLHSEKKSYM